MVVMTSIKESPTEFRRVCAGKLHRLAHYDKQSACLDNCEKYKVSSFNIIHETEC